MSDQTASAGQPDRTPIRIFISSPGDVVDERRRAALVISRIRREFSRFFEVSPILWEYEPMLSSGHFQDSIEQPSKTDIVVLILWSRLGTALPEDRYRGIDGRAPVTGTEWEYEDALAAHRDRGAPDLLVYRKTAPAQASFADAEGLEAARRQWDAVQGFWLRHFVNQDGTFKAAFNQFQSLDQFEQALEAHLRSLLRDRLNRILKDEHARPVAWHAGSPFRGLQVFDREHAAIFFGREKAEQEVVEALARRAQAGEAFVVVLGSSGSGKSSLLRAGVLPNIESPGVVPGVSMWRRLIVTPAELGPEPLHGLAERLLSDRVLPEASGPGGAGELALLLRNAPAEAAAQLRSGLDAAAQAAGVAGGATPAQLVLLADQLEEVFTAAAFEGAGEREAFAAALAALARSGAVWVAASIRADFFPRLSELEALDGLATGEGVYSLAAPRPAEIEQMIRQPAQSAGVVFEADPATGVGLDSELLEAAVRSPDALPLLEFTLDELYRRDVEAGGGAALTFATYRSLGGLEGAIAAQAESVVAGLPSDAADALPRALRALVTVGEDERLSARTASMASLRATAGGAALVDALVASRLLTVTDQAGRPVARLVHEALLRAWPRAAGLIEEDRQLLRTRARVEAAAQRWQAEGENPDFLLQSGRPLAEASELRRARADELEPLLVRFVEASEAAEARRRQAELDAERAMAEAEAAAARRLAQRTRTAAAILGLAALVAGGLGVYASVQRGQAVRQRNAALESQSRFLADAATNAINAGDPRLGRLLALAALPARLDRPDRPYVREAEAALAQAEAQDRLIAVQPPAADPPPAKSAPPPDTPEWRKFRVQAAAMKWITASGDGRSLAIVANGQGQVYDLDRRLILTVADPGNPQTIALDRTGRQLAFADRTGVVVWDVARRQSRRLATGLADAPLHLVFTPDGQRLAVGGDKGGVAIFSLPDGRRLAVGQVSGSAFPVVSADSRRVLVPGHDGRAVLFDAASGRQVAVLEDTGAAGADAASRQLRMGASMWSAFSPDGRLAASTTGPDRVRLWDAATGAALGEPVVLSRPIQKLAFTPDSRRLSVVDATNRTWLWWLDAPADARPIWAGARTATPAPDDRRVLVSDAEGLKVLDASGRPLRTLVAGAGVGDNAWSPDGKTVAAVVDGGKAVMLGSPDSGALTTAYRAGPGETVQSLGFTSRGGRLIVIIGGGPAALLDPRSGRLVARIGSPKFNAVGLVSGGDDVLLAGPGAVGELYGPDGGRRARFAQPSKPVSPAVAALHLPDFGFFSDITGDASAGLVATVNPLGGATLWNARSGAAVGHVQDAAALGALRFVLQPGTDGWAAEANANSTIAVWSWPKHGVGFAASPSRRLSDPSGVVSWMRPTPDGRLLALVRGKTLTLWDPITGRRLVQYDNVAQARVSPDGRVVILIGGDGVARRAVLPLSGQALISAARAKGGALTAEERARYFLAAR